MNTEVAEKITQPFVPAVINPVLPFSIVENEEFIEFVKLLQPRYVPPSCQTIQRRILNEYANFKDRLRNQIFAKIELKISITVDGWYSRMYRSYFVITAHWIDGSWKMQSILLDFIRFPTPHDGESVKNLIECCLRQWNLTQKVAAVTSDNGSEMCSGIRLLGNSLGRTNFHVRCMVHIVNIAAKAVFAIIHKFVSSIRKIVGAIRVSAKGRERFDSSKEALNLSNILLPALDVETRWSSTYFMLDRALSAESILNTMVAESEDLHRFSVSPMEWTTASKLCIIL